MVFRKNLLILCIVSYAITLLGKDNPSISGITYIVYSEGRFGDKLLTYCRAKWLAYKYNIPLLYKPFIYSDQLMLHMTESHYENSKNTFKGAIILKDKSTPIERNKGVLYTLPYFPESEIELTSESLGLVSLCRINWQDKGFLSILRNYIRPRYHLTLTSIPKNCITVAVHVRKGGGFDPVNLIGVFPVLGLHALKFPPDSYYIEQIKRVSDLLHNQPLYVHIFTDDSNPVAIVKQYKAAVNRSNIKFGCRTSNNSHSSNVLEDFFSLPKFNCLIRSDSNFSIVASKLGNYRIVISPKHYIVRNGHFVIDQVNVEVT
jgi:hypothetical protein